MTEPVHGPHARSAERLDLQHALGRLPPAMREVLLLVTVEEYFYAEAAAILDVPVGTVMSSLHRARERLRKSMDAAGVRPAPPLHRVK